MNLLRPTIPHVEADAPDETATDPESRGGDPVDETRQTTSRSRRRRLTPTGKTKGFKIHLTEDMHNRLWLTARKRKMSVSAVAMLALDSYLPRLEIREAV